MCCRPAPLDDQIQIIRYLNELGMDEDADPGYQALVSLDVGAA